MNEIQFNPLIEESEDRQPTTIKSIIMAISMDFIRLGNLITRNDTGGVGDYMIDIKFDLNIRR